MFHDQLGSLDVDLPFDKIFVAKRQRSVLVCNLVFRSLRFAMLNKIEGSFEELSRSPIREEKVRAIFQIFFQSIFLA